MKQILLVVCAIFALSFTTPDNTVIVWSKTRKLKISDFVQSEESLPHGATAITSTGIFIEKDNTRPCGWRAYGVFDKIGSKWYVYGQRKYDQLILQHEQIHFDITNYMAVQLDNHLKSLKEPLSQNMLNDLYNQQRARLDSMQKWYDKSSDHSRDSLSQSKWNRYVDSLLRK